MQPAQCPTTYIWPHRSARRPRLHPRNLDRHLGRRGSFNPLRAKTPSAPSYVTVLDGTVGAPSFNPLRAKTPSAPRPTATPASRSAPVSIRSARRPRLHHRAHAYLFAAGIVCFNPLRAKTPSAPWSGKQPDQPRSSFNPLRAKTPSAPPCRYRRRWPLRRFQSAPREDPVCTSTQKGLRYKAGFLRQFYRPPGGRGVQTSPVATNFRLTFPISPTSTSENPTWRTT